MERYSVEESRNAWNANAEFWDEQMGDASNEFHRTVVRPGVSRLLNVQPGDFVLDVACGNGNYSAYMAERGARVVAFDYSEKMIALARKRQKKYAGNIEFCVADATNERDLMDLKRGKPYGKAVSNMAVMDIADVTKLFFWVNKLLAADGIFVFATQHPCFVTLTDRYLTPHAYFGEAILGQPQQQCYYHRSLQEILGLCFSGGFAVDGFLEERCGEKETPDVIIVRARKKAEL